MLISLRTLERQLDWIGRRFTFVSLDEINDSRRRRVRGDAPRPRFTFDDGYRDTFLHALPLLERKGSRGPCSRWRIWSARTRLQTHDALFLLLRRALASWRRPVISSRRRSVVMARRARQARRLLRRARDARFLTPRDPRSASAGRRGLSESRP